MKTRNQFKLFIAAAVFAGTSVSAQLVDEADVSITMDLQPVLQLDMETPTQINFIFDEISEYKAGITQYGATILKVSSSVSWDLYAVGRSQVSGDRFWDQQITYGTTDVSGNRVGNIPLSALELHQNTKNPSVTTTPTLTDYSTPFLNPRRIVPNTESGGVITVEEPSTNNIYVSTTGDIPGTTDRYIAGHSGPGALTSMPGGSYNGVNYAGTPASAAGGYYHVIDYRIVPGLPATFPMASTSLGVTEALDASSGEFAAPGVYTMYVQYILLEDQ